MKEKLKNLICGIIVFFPIVIVLVILLVAPIIFDFGIVYWIVLLSLILGSPFILLLYAVLHELGKEHLEENPTGKIAKFFNKK
jgi:hypothetical protein